MRRGNGMLNGQADGFSAGLGRPEESKQGPFPTNRIYLLKSDLVSRVSKPRIRQKRPAARRRQDSPH
jgi:hypothetical protein